MVAKQHESTEQFARITGRAAAVGGILALGSLVTVLAGEAAQGEDFMGSGAAIAAGWAGFAAAGLLVLGLGGLAVRYVELLGTGGRAAMLVLTLAATVMVGASSTLAVVVPALVDRAPDVVDDPPAAVPATFILSGLVMGVAGVLLAAALRRTQIVPGWTTTLVIVASVVTIVPLPSRFFVLAFAVAALLMVPLPGRADAAGRDLAGVGRRG